MKNFKLTARILVRKERDSIFDIKAETSLGSIWFQWYNQDEDFCLQINKEVAKELIEALQESINELEEFERGKEKS